MSEQQLELPLEMPVYDHYHVVISKGPTFGETTLRQHKAETVEDAIGLINGLRDTYRQRDNITWQSEEVNDEGKLYGLAQGGDVYLIQVTPPLSVDLG